MCSHESSLEDLNRELENTLSLIHPRLVNQLLGSFWVCTPRTPLVCRAIRLQAKIERIKTLRTPY